MLNSECKFKYFYYSVMFSLLVMGIIFITSVVIMIWPSKVLEIENFEVYEAIGNDRLMRSYSIEAGGEIEFDVFFVKHTDAQATVTVLLKQVDDGYLYPFPDTRTTRMPLGRWHYKSSLVIPKTTPPGKYIIIRTYRYQLNSLRTFTIEVASNVFEVTKYKRDPLEIIMEGNKISEENQRKLKRIEDRLR